VSAGSKKTIKISHLMVKAPERYQDKDYNKLTLKQFEGLIPKELPSVIKEDIALYFNYLRKNRSKNSLKQWETASGCKDSPNSYKTENYRPIFSFLYYDRITEGLFLPLLLNKIDIAAGSHAEEISISEFNQLSRLTLIGFKPKIDAIDLKILHALSKDPSMVTQTLTDKIGHSYAAVYHHLQRLKGKMGLRITTRVNWAKLGVQRVFLISDEEKGFEAFKDFKPFLDGQSSFLWGGTYYLQYYLLRNEIREIFFKKYQALAEKQKQSIKLYELSAAPITGYSFDLYNLEEQKWDFDFASTFLKPKTVKIKKEDKRELFTDTFPPEIPYELNELEQTIISELVASYSLAQKEIASSLGIHPPNLSIIKSKLQKDTIVRPQLMVSSILPLYCILWCSSQEQEIIDILITLMEKIPFANISPVSSPNDTKTKQLICYLLLDDVLYYSLVTFLMKLTKENRLNDFRLGLITDAYFSVAKITDVLNKEI